MSCSYDNAAVVAIVNSGRSKVEKVMHLMRCLSFFLARWEMSLVCSHIPGIQNGAADALSRVALSSFQLLMPGASKVPTELPDSMLDCLVTRLDKRGLGQLVCSYFVRGLADSTHRVYSCGQKRFLQFCAAAGLLAAPASEEVLCMFVAKLAAEGLKHRSIKTYMAWVRHLHIEEGLGDPFMPVFTRFHYVLRGVKRAQGEAGAGRRERLPITPPILRKIRGVWGRAPDDPDHIMLWAACCLAFFGFLRAGELTVPNDSAFAPSVHLAWGDLAVDKPAVLSVRIKASKTDPFRRGIAFVHWSGPIGLVPCVSGPCLLGASEGQGWPALHILRW